MGGIWLEFVPDTVGKPWPLAHYAAAARRLGRSDSAYLTGRCPLPAFPWVARDGLRKIVETASPAYHFLHEHPTHPTVKKWFPGIVRGLFLAAWEERNYMLAILEAMPQVFCNMDPFVNNLIAHADRLVVIDWAGAGLAAPGSMLADLVMIACSASAVPGRQVRRLEKLVMDGYLCGLREGGAQPDERVIKLAYGLTVMLRSALMSVTYFNHALMPERYPHNPNLPDLQEFWIGKGNLGFLVYMNMVCLETLRTLGRRGAMFSRAWEFTRHPDLPQREA